MNYLGARRGFALAFALERAAREGRTQDLGPALASLENELAGISSILVHYLEGNSPQPERSAGAVETPPTS